MMSVIIDVIIEEENRLRELVDLYYERWSHSVGEEQGKYLEKIVHVNENLRGIEPFFNLAMVVAGNYTVKIKEKQ